MSAANYDLLIEKFSTFEVFLQIKEGQGETAVAANITGKTLRMQIRSAPPSSEFLIELNTGNNGIVITDAENGSVKLFISEADTTNFSWERGFYDLLLIDDNRTRRILQGAVTIRDGVTR